ncbi:MAG: hypothetical protein MZV64_31835 [Ignavibacteriales bacterium]|nr:hypothetical protein [Ignavibacteriales bacterium]
MRPGSSRGIPEEKDRRQRALHHEPRIAPGLAPWGAGSLFELLGDAAAAIGVRLTGSMVIMPLKSVSGIQFISDEGFVNWLSVPERRVHGKEGSVRQRVPYGARYEAVSRQQCPVLPPTDPCSRISQPF